MQAATTILWQIAEKCKAAVPMPALLREVVAQYEYVIGMGMVWGRCRKRQQRHQQQTAEVEMLRSSTAAARVE